MLFGAFILGQTKTEDAIDEWKEVLLDQGPVRGYKDPEVDVFVFHGIPYASAPKGPDKFKAPLPPPTWKEPFEAVDKGVMCPQHPVDMGFKKKFIYNEDCLIANVFVPDADNKNLPVVVYVHGGGYQVGFGNSVTPKKLVRGEKIIAITFNYRLGAHGFLCLGTKEAPGNAGMKDIVALLRWVKKNIEKFGGNPEEVTIAGYSSGAAAVELLMLSDLTRGLFNKAIPESGSALASFTIQRDPLANAKKFAKKMNVTDVDDIEVLEKFYTKASFKKLTANTFSGAPGTAISFEPCIERDIGEEAFLTEAPVNIISKGKYQKVPILFGICNMEGLVRVNYFEMWLEKFNSKFSQYLPSNLKFESQEQKEEIAKKVKEFYFGKKTITESNILAYIDYFTDVMFAFPVLRSVKMHLEAGHDRIYLYEYSFVDEDTMPIPYVDVKGADHIAQTNAVLDGLNATHYDESMASKTYKRMKARMREMWTNFIVTGKPVPEDSILPKWPPVEKDWSPHMSIGEVIELRGSLLEKRAKLWDEIYQQFYYNPIPPATLETKHTEL